jgi:hypothetical protein
MRTKKVLVLLASAAASAVLMLPVLVRAQGAAGATEYLNKKAPWIGHEQEIEDYLRTVEILSTSGTGEGVTHPKKAKLPPGGPTDTLFFKAVPEGPQGGAMEGYKEEIAAYQIDQMLRLGMVPPTVEKVYQKQKGAAVYGIAGVKNFNELGSKNGGAPTPPDSSKQEYWNVQLTRAKMFDCLVDNQDPNLGNWLANADWTLFIIDHSRALHGDVTCVHQKTINHTDLTAKLSMWMGKSEIKAIITSRDNLGKMIDGLVKKNGEANVFIKAGL